LNHGGADESLGAIARQTVLAWSCGLAIVGSVESDDGERLPGSLARTRVGWDTGEVTETPTWELVLDAARELHARVGEFRLDELIRQVQAADPARGRGTIQPTVQGMTVNAGTGPLSPCGKPLYRVRRGYYTLVG